MLKSMRKHAKFFYFLFFIVILSFIFWGVGTLDQPTVVSVAEIGNERITVEEYWRSYERMRAMYREMTKGQLNEEMEKKLNLKEMVLNNLVDDRVMLIAAKEMGITVTDKELQDVVTNDPRFMREGKFRKDIYFRTLELNRLTPEAYESALRQDRILQKARKIVQSAVEIDLLTAGAGAAENPNQKQFMLMNARSAALRSFVDAAKVNLDVKIKKELIS